MVGGAHLPQPRRRAVARRAPTPRPRCSPGSSPTGSATGSTPAASARAPAGSLPWPSRCTSPTSRGRATSGRREHPEVVHVVVPEGVDDPTTPSGGNVYDRRLCEELTRSGWPVQELTVPTVEGTLAGVLAGLPDGAVALVDGLVAVAAPDAMLRESSRLRLVVLLHMPFGERDADIRALERQVLAAATAVVTTSEWSRRWVLRHYGLRPRSRARRRSRASTPPSSRPGSEAGGATALRRRRHPRQGPRRAARCPGRGRRPAVAAHLRGLAVEGPPASAERAQRAAVARGIADRVTLRRRRCRATSSTRPTPRPTCSCCRRGAESWGMVVTEALARGIPVARDRGRRAPGGARRRWRRVAGPGRRRARAGRCAAPLARGRGAARRRCAQQPGPVVRR